MVNLAERPNRYHLFIRQNGHVDWTVPFETRDASCKDFNKCAISVALFGCFVPGAKIKNQHPRPEQIQALISLIHNLDWWFGRKLIVKGHSELGLSGTSHPAKVSDPREQCPGPNLDLDSVRRATGRR